MFISQASETRNPILSASSNFICTKIILKLVGKDVDNTFITSNNDVTNLIMIKEGDLFV